MTDAILTCSEHFTDLALNELRRPHPRIQLIDRLSPQHLLIHAPGSFDKLTRPWRDRLPIYLHHLFPVHHRLALTGTAADFAHLRRLAGTCGDECVVQARIAGEYPYSTYALEQAIRPGQDASDTVRATGRVLSILVVDRCGYLGVSRAEQNLSPYATGRPYFDEPVPNRAGLKLLEALAAFDIRLRPGDHALDLGAAPGAWTEVLRRRGMVITAVAPDAMYDWLQVDPNVRAFTMTAEAYLPRCETIYDLIVNDMRLDARDSARLMAAYAERLRPQGIAIMTLKLRLRDPRRLMDHAFRILRRRYKIIRVRQLVSNRKEVTVLLRAK